MFNWLVIAHVLLVINGEIQNWSVRPVPPAFYVAALLLLSLPCLTSTTGVCVSRHVLSIAHEHEHSYSHLCVHGASTNTHSTAKQNGRQCPLEIFLPGCSKMFALCGS